METAEIIRILEDLGAGLIGMEEVARRAGILEREPGRYNCGTCRHFKASQCWRPGQPPRAEHPYSVRCGDYEFDDPRDTAPFIDPRRGSSRMWK